MADRNLILPSGATFEIRHQADGTLEVKKQGDKAGTKVPAVVEKITIDGSTKRLLASLKGGRKVLWVYARGNKRILSWPGGSIELDAADLTEGAGAGGGSLKPLKLTMPGKVLSVKVKEGDTVEPGQGLVIVEAMKMENLLLADKKAVVGKVHVKEGDRLESGALLITFQEAT